MPRNPLYEDNLEICTRLQYNLYLKEYFKKLIIDLCPVEIICECLIKNCKSLNQIVDRSSSYIIDDCCAFGFKISYDTLWNYLELYI